MLQQLREPTDPPTGNSRVSVAEPAGRRIDDKPGVLVVDDEHFVRSMVQLALERYGFDVWAAPDGYRAIELYRDHRDAIDVVLLDIRMPGLDGPATLRALRELDPEITACFMSGDLGGWEPGELLRLGARHLILKPFLLDDLAKILRRLTHAAPADLLPAGGVTPSRLGWTGAPLGST